MSLNLIRAVAAIKRSIARHLTAESIEAACRAEDSRWRRRELGPARTVHAFLLQVLHGNTACAHVVRLADLNCSATAYCQSRAKLPSAVYQRLLDPTSRSARRRCATPVGRGHRTFLVDGSSFSMPDTRPLQTRFGQHPAQRPGCGFPTAHWLTLFDAHSGLLIKQLAGPWRTHDLSRAAELHPELSARDVLVGDSAFASYAHLALLFRQNLHGLFRAHQRQLVSFRRDRRLTGKRPKGTQALFAGGRLIRKLGRFDQWVEYAKTKRCPKWLGPEAYAALPDRLVVRELRYQTRLKGGRTRTVTLVTTLLDPADYPAEALAALYGSRWEAETNLAHLKTTMGLDVLRSKTVDGVLKEMTIFAIVYNLARWVMLAAAEEQQTAVRRVSFIDALRWLEQASRRTAPLRLVIHPRRRPRQEPRVRKRRPKSFKLMTQPRCKLRLQLDTKRLTP